MPWSNEKREAASKLTQAIKDEAKTSKSLSSSFEVIGEAIKTYFPYNGSTAPLSIDASYLWQHEIWAKNFATPRTSVTVFRYVMWNKEKLTEFIEKCAVASEKLRGYSTTIDTYFIKPLHDSILLEHASFEQCNNLDDIDNRLAELRDQSKVGSLNASQKQLIEHTKTHQPQLDEFASRIDALREQAESILAMK